jgi:hypothetical protein
VDIVFDLLEVQDIVLKGLQSMIKVMHSTGRCAVEMHHIKQKAAMSYDRQPSFKYVFEKIIC